MKNAIIILCYNDCDTSIKYIEHIIKYDSIQHLVVIDNGSIASKRECLERKLKIINSGKISYIKNNINVGYARGNNIGIRYALSQLKVDNIIVSNTDVIYSEDTLIRCINFLEEKENVGLVSPKMIKPNGEECMSAWKLPTYKQLLWNSLFVLKKIYNPQEYRILSGSYAEVDVLPGSLLIGKAKVWDDVGGFDEDTFLYGEESLLAYKVLNKGYTNYLIVDSSYIHAHSTIINSNINSFYRKMKYLYDANKIYNKKCLKTNEFQDALYFMASYINIGVMYIYQLVKKWRY